MTEEKKSGNWRTIHDNIQNKSMSGFRNSRCITISELDREDEAIIKQIEYNKRLANWHRNAKLIQSYWRQFAANQIITGMKRATLKIQKSLIPMAYRNNPENVVDENHLSLGSTLKNTDDVLLNSYIMDNKSNDEKSKLDLRFECEISTPNITRSKTEVNQNLMPDTEMSITETNNSKKKLDLNLEQEIINYRTKVDKVINSEVVTELNSTKQLQDLLVSIEHMLANTKRFLPTTRMEARVAQEADLENKPLESLANKRIEPEDKLLNSNKAAIKTETRPHSKHNLTNESLSEKALEIEAIQLQEHSASILVRDPQLFYLVISRKIQNTIKSETGHPLNEYSVNERIFVKSNPSGKDFCKEDTVLEINRKIHYRRADTSCVFYAKSEYLQINDCSNA